MKSSILSDVERAIRNHKFELNDAGIAVVSGGGPQFCGFFTPRYAPPGGEFGPMHVAGNRVVGQGLNKLLNLLGGHTASAPLYLAPFTENVEPADGWLGSTFPSTAVEFTAYTNGTRVPWTTVQTSTKLLTNEAALAAATITFSAGGPYTLRGCALVESSVKGGTTGQLIAAARFDADLAGMTAGGKLALLYTLGALDEDDA